MCQSKAQGGQRCFKDTCPTYMNSIKSGNVDKAKDTGRGIILTPNSIENFRNNGEKLISENKTVIVEGRQTVSSLENLNNNLDSLEEQNKTKNNVEESLDIHQKYFRASNSNDLELLSNLIEDEDPRIRYAVLLNKYSTSDLIGKLVNDPDETNRTYLAGHRKTRVEVLEELSKDTNEDVLDAVAYNKKSSPTALENILNNENANKWSKEKAVESLAEHKKVSIEQLNNIIESEMLNEHLASIIAKNNNADKNILENLYNKYPSSIPVILGVVSNPSTTKEMLDDIYIKDSNTPPNERFNVSSYKGEIRSSLCRHPNTPDYILNKYVDEEVYKSARNMIAGRQNITMELASKLVKNEETSVRSILAGNPSTPKEILGELLNDKEIQVRTNAFYNPNMPSPELHEVPKEWVQNLLGGISFRDSDEAKYNKNK